LEEAFLTFIEGDADFRQTAGYIRLQRMGDIMNHPRFQAERTALAESLTQPRRKPQLSKLKTRARKAGVPYARYIENELPSALYGIKDLLQTEVIDLGKGYSYVSPERLVFRPLHYAVSQSKVEGYEPELKRGAPLPPIEVIPISATGEFWIKEGHHRAVAAYLSEADYIKVHKVDGEIIFPFLSSSPFKNETPIPIKFILLSDEAWEGEV
jgi:hypothetical protein